MNSIGKINRRRFIFEKKPATWLRELRCRVTRPEDLPQGFSLDREESHYFREAARRKREALLPFAVTRYYLALSDSKDPEDPIRRQFLPRIQELEARPYELEDPLGEERFQPVPRLLHRYRDRALLLVTYRCATYCRHCFRRRLTSRPAGVIRTAYLARAAAYLQQHPEIEELILSGGDPLLLADGRLETIFSLFRKVRPGLAFRIHTRMPVVLPARITPQLAGLMQRHAPVRVATQFNHPKELAEPALAALRLLKLAGIPLINQSVLLKGVNDRPGVLAGLFRGLIRAGVQPYYLFQPDLARGTAHFRPSIAEGLETFAQAARLCQGAGLPRYVLDLPGGGGKLQLDHAIRLLLADGFYRFRSEKGELFRYPAE